MTTYTVTAERSGKWWVLQAVEAPGAISQVVRLDQADEIKEAIAFVTGEPEARIEIDVRPTIPEDVERHIAEAKKLRDEAELANTGSAREVRAAARAMKDLGWTVRDIGAVMKVSHQRAQQLVSEPVRRVPRSQPKPVGSRRSSEVA